MFLRRGQGVSTRLTRAFDDDRWNRQHGLVNDSGNISLEARMALAREVFGRRFAMCFWSWSRETVITPELLPNVAHALRQYGGRAEFILSERICPSTLYKARYLPRYARAATRTAT